MDLDLLCERVIEAEVAIGPYKGNRTFIPRIPIIQLGPNISIKFRRLQFPLKLWFAMTINKSQAQTLGKVGLYLERPVFSHGQLYVGASRVMLSS
jgi:ATP-dependent DNA helicase PIF1